MMGPFNNPNVDESGFYVPFYATPFGPAPPTLVANQFATVVVKPHVGQQAESLLKTLRREVTRIDPNLPLYFAGTPKQNLAGFVAGNRIIASMFTIFGGVAVVLAAVGIYGVMSFSVNQRRQEFGVRMALGADNGRILSIVLKQGSRQVITGLAIGVGLSLAIAAVGRDAIGSILFGVSALDPLTYGAVIALVAGVSLAAVLVPARRATRVDPMLALRAE
jgi:ABC-type antimicrobial peptide transport system permease subunit